MSSNIGLGLKKKKKTTSKPKQQIVLDIRYYLYSIMHITSSLHMAEVNLGPPPGSALITHLPSGFSVITPQGTPPLNKTGCGPGLLPLFWKAIFMAGLRSPWLLNNYKYF